MNRAGFPHQRYIYNFLHSPNQKRKQYHGNCTDSLLWRCGISPDGNILLLPYFFLAQKFSFDTDLLNIWYVLCLKLVEKMQFWQSRKSKQKYKSVLVSQLSAKKHL